MSGLEVRRHSRSTSSYLFCRGGIYYLRVRVPLRHQDRVGAAEVRRSLQVCHPRTARRLALKLSARVFEVFDMMEANPLPKSKVQQLIHRAFAEMERTTGGGFIPCGPYPDIEIEEQQEISRERISALTDEITTLSFSPETRVKTMLLAARAGLRFDEQPEATQYDLMHGVARIELEQARLMMFRISDRLSPYHPHDSLFADPVIGPTALHGHAIQMPMAMAEDITLGDLIDAYLAFGSTHWTAKTVSDRKRKLSLLAECLGVTTPARAIDTGMMRDYRDLLLRLRRSHGKAKSLAAKVTEKTAERVAPKTASLAFESAKALLRWATEEGHLEANPAIKLRVKLPPAKDALASERRPFTSTELASLFSSPVFAGCKSVACRFEPGNLHVRDGKFWIPIIGHYTGMRLGEIVQLHLSDVVTECEIPFFSVSEQSEGNSALSDAKHVKSKAGVRKVPIHPDLLVLGFGDFVRGVRKKRNGKGRLFHEIKYGADGMPSSTFSKWFSRLRKSAGITDSRVVFHSFRHGAVDALRETEAPKYIIDQIIGHAEQVTASYGQGVSLETLYETVKKMKFVVDLKTIVQKAS